ncbi:MAG TPA: hypothetical protein VM581_02245 [Magnetospirillaceae bacterium]|nr:hypothetical protein [Magnetospirillaceae bacterium]
MGIFDSFFESGKKGKNKKAKPWKQQQPRPSKGFGGSNPRKNHDTKGRNTHGRTF